MNLASSFVNGFVNAAFGQDKLLTDDGNKWLYKNKDHGEVGRGQLLHSWSLAGKVGRARRRALWLGTSGGQDQYQKGHVL